MRLGHQMSVGAFRALDWYRGSIVGNALADLERFQGLPYDGPELRVHR